jgi:DNA-binding beta-propeller fold protein YncE
MKRFLWLGLVLCVYVICTGCGDTFRPIIIPNPPVFPNPKGAHTVVAINDNAPQSGPDFVQGTAMVIDVSGDTDESIANVGLAPVYAVQQSAFQMLVVNHSTPGAGSDSLTQLAFSGTTIGSASTITLPPNSGPNFVAVAPSSTTAFVTLQTLNEVGVVSTTSNSLLSTTAVGSNPDAAAVTSDNKKLYVANKESDSVSGFNILTQQLSPRTVNGSFNGPLWLITRSDNQRLYVLGSDGVVSTVDTTSTAGPDSVIDASVNVPGATYMLYDSNLNRLYIPWQGQLTILDVSQSAPNPLATITVPSYSLLNVQNPVPAIATAVAALPDGSRAYVSSYAVLPTQLSISSVSGDGTTATYAYTLTAGHDLNPGMMVTIAGTTTNTMSFDGTFTVSAILSGTTACPGMCFQVSNLTSGTWPPPGTSGSASGIGSNIFSQVTAVWTNSNTIKTTTEIPGFPDATVQTLPNSKASPYYVSACVTTRFRFMMAAAGDSSRAYLSSCDGGNVNVIDTSTDTYILNIQAPIGTRPPIAPSGLNQPQNPVFLIAGP